MRTLIKSVSNLPWMPQPHEARLYLTDTLPPLEQCGTAFGFVFQDDKLLMTRLRDRDWDIPGGAIDSGETPEQAAIREVWEETNARVEIIELIGIQETHLTGERPANYRWPFPISVQVYYLCRLVELCPFEANAESSERGFVAPDVARKLPTMWNHDLIYEESLRRALRLP